MITIVEKAWKIQNRIEKRLPKLKNKTPIEDILYWRHGDYTLFFLMTNIFLGIGIIVIFFIDTDYWLLPVGISEVFLFLFLICKKVEGE